MREAVHHDDVHVDAARHAMISLRRTAAVLARELTADGDAPLLARFAERLEGLLDEYAWEAGLMDVPSSSAAVSRPAGAFDVHPSPTSGDA